MRTIKLFAVALMLALAGAVYAANVSQDAETKQRPVKAAEGCCQKHGAPRAATQAATKHGGESCCAGGCCRAAGACASEPEGSCAHSLAATGLPAGRGSDSSSCCAAPCCAECRQAAGARQGDANDFESCCKYGAVCCKEGGKDCCKIHKSDAKQFAARSSGTEPIAASCGGGGGSCACGG